MRSSEFSLGDRVIQHLSCKAFAHFSAYDLFTKSEVNFLGRACSEVPKEEIRTGLGDSGEAISLDVGRFLSDKKDEVPQFCNEPLGSEVVSTLSNDKATTLFGRIMEGDFWIRRCQAHCLRGGSHIGKHVDNHSNLTYRYSVVIQFGSDYDGGEFFVDYDGQEQEIKTSFADVLINKCEVSHGVRPVKAGRRLSLVFFLSESPLSQPNTENRQI